LLEIMLAVSISASILSAKFAMSVDLALTIWRSGGGLTSTTV
jgi:type II secretory pathway component PulJ